MSTLYTVIVLGFTLISLTLIFFKVRIFWVLGSLLIASQMVCLFDIFRNQPSQVTWLCNMAVFLNIFLLFKFHQKTFDVFFYYTWIGCFYICLMPINPYSLSIKDLPVIWIAYWIKHITPLLMTVYFLYVQKRKLSHWSCYTGVFSFLSYCAVMYFYNRTFNENILYLNEPAPFMEPLGKYYFLIIVPIGYFCVALMYITVALCGRVKSKNEYLPKDKIQALKVDRN